MKQPITDLLIGKAAHLPDPGPPPNWRTPARTRAQRKARMTAEHDWSVRDRVYRAIHTNDPWLRAFVAHSIRDSIVAGRPLHVAERAWLAWTLTRMVAMDAVPSLATGNAIQRDLIVERWRLLAPFALALKPGDRVGASLDKAAEALHLSYSSVRTIWYSAPFKTYVATARAGLSK